MLLAVNAGESTAPEEMSLRHVDVRYGCTRRTTRAGGSSPEGKRKLRWNSGQHLPQGSIHLSPQTAVQTWCRHVIHKACLHTATACTRAFQQPQARSCPAPRPATGPRPWAPGPRGPLPAAGCSAGHRDVNGGVPVFASAPPPRARPGELPCTRLLRLCPCVWARLAEGR